MTLSSDGPTTLSPARIRFALLALALGGFGIGATEFVAMGLLPNIAAGPASGVYARRPRRPTPRPGWMISAYALGVVVGAPTIAAAAARWPRKRLLLALLTAFTLGTVASALLPTFELVLVARFVAALPHGAYFGIASLVAASLMGPGKRARGVALVLSGLTIANVVGVPAITWLGQAAGWRIAYLAVAGIFALTFVAVLARRAVAARRPARDRSRASCARSAAPRCGSRSASARSASAGSSRSTATSRRSPPRSPDCRRRSCRSCSSCSGSA